MDTTDDMLIPYPTAGDPAEGHLQMQAIATLVDTTIGAAWTDISSTVPIGGFNPGQFQVQARYKRIGNTVFYAGKIYVTTANPQNGLVTVGLPVASDGTSGRTLGVGFANTGTGIYGLAAVQLGSALVFKSTGGGKSLGEDTTTVTYAVGNYLLWNIRYSAA